MLHLMLAAGVAIMPPVPLNAQDWVKTEDYPRQALLETQRGYVLFRLVVSPDGGVVTCDTEGKSMLDRAFCRLASERGRFRPAVDEAGKPVFAVHQSRAKFLLVGTAMPPPPLRGDIELTVDRLPPGAQNPSYSEVVLMVDERGQPGACRAEREDAQTAELAEFLGSISCAELRRAHRFDVVRDVGGKAVPYVRTTTVKYVTQAGG